MSFDSLVNEMVRRNMEEGGTGSFDSRKTRENGNGKKRETHI